MCACARNVDHWPHQISVTIQPSEAVGPRITPIHTNKGRVHHGVTEDTERMPQTKTSRRSSACLAPSALIPLVFVSFCVFCDELLQASKVLQISYILRPTSNIGRGAQKTPGQQLPALGGSRRARPRSRLSRGHSRLTSCLWRTAIESIAVSPCFQVPPAAGPVEVIRACCGPAKAASSRCLRSSTRETKAAARSSQSRN